jgi:hypothetical protein
MFRASFLPIIRGFLPTIGTGKFHAGLWWPLPSKTCMKLTSAECTLENSWLWA